MKLRYRPGAARRYAPADGSSTVAKIAGSTSVRVRVRSPRISCGQWWLAVYSQRAYNLDSCAMGQTDGS